MQPTKLKTTAWLVWQALKAKARRYYFGAFYRKVVDIKPDRMDGRPAEVLTLECGHTFWRYSLPQHVINDKRLEGWQVGNYKLRLCDSCLNIYLNQKYGKKEADRRYATFCKWIKGR